MDDGKYNLKAKNNGKEHVQINVQYRLILKIIKKQKQTKKHNICNIAMNDITIAASQFAYYLS